MAFKVTVQSSGRHFQAEPGEPILTAALRQGISLPYGCKNGACGSCKGAVLQGTVAQLAHAPSALSDDEHYRGMALFCCATAQSDLVIQVREVLGVSDMPIKRLPCRVAACTRAADDVMIVKLQLPANERLHYLAGQYLDFLLKDGKRRSYSMATALHHAGPLELHIRHLPGGVFTDHVFSTMKERDLLRFEGPLGAFFMRKESTKPIVFVASGTGFAPIKAMVEEAIFSGNPRPMTLYWGARRKKDLYLRSLAEQWARDLPCFRFVPVLSEPAPEDGWTGRIGLVHQTMIEDLPDLSNYQVYACGAPAMVDSAQREFTAHHGLPSEEFYADAFTSEADDLGRSSCNANFSNRG